MATVLYSRCMALECISFDPSRIRERERERENEMYI